MQSSRYIPPQRRGLNPPKPLVKTQNPCPRALRNSKVPLPLIGTNYEWYRDEKCVAGTKAADTVPQSPYEPRVSGGKYFKDQATQYRWYTDPTFSGYNVYRYNRIDNIVIEPNERLVRASYIPYITTEKDIYWLLGSFHDYPEIKVDFGGACDQNEDAETCATRELGEETQNVLIEPVKNALDQGKVTVFKGYGNKDRTNKIKVIFFIMVNIDTDFEMLDSIQDTIDKKFKEKFKNNEPEKDDLFGPLGFYSESDILNNRGINNRPFYTSYNLTDFIHYYRKYKINNMAERYL